MPNDHTACPVAGCERKIRRDQVLCLKHWRKVPRPLQEAVWRGYRDDPGGAYHLRAVREAVEAAQAAG